MNVSFGTRAYCRNYTSGYPRNLKKKRNRVAKMATCRPICRAVKVKGVWWCILATWAQELVNVSCGFRKVYTGPCGRTGLETPTWSICRAVRSQQVACMRPVRFFTRSIGSARMSRVCYSRWKSLSFSQGLSPTVPKLCKTLCGFARHT